MATVIDSLLVRLGFSVDPKGMEGFAKTAEQGKLKMVAFSAAATAALYGVEKFFKGAAEKMGGVWNFSEQTGIAARSVAALGKVAEENDSSLEAMEGGLRSLTNMAGQAAMKIGRGAMVFKRMGLQAKDANGTVKSTEELLGDVADKIHKLPTLTQQQAFGARLGFDPATVLLLAKGREEFGRLRDEALKKNPFRNADYEMADKTEKAFRRAEANASQLRNRLAVALMPQVINVLDGMGKWMRNEGNIKKLQQLLAHLAEIAKLVARHFKKVTGTIIGLKLASKGLNTLLRGGLLGLFILLADDLWTFHRGGKSVTGWLENQWPYSVDVAVAALDILGAALVAITLGSGPVGVFVGAIGGIIIAAIAIHDAWNPLMQWFGEEWDKLADKVRLFAKIATWPAWLILKVTGGAANVDYVYGKDKGPTGVQKTIQDSRWMDENDWKARNSSFNDRFNKAPQVEIPTGQFDFSRAQYAGAGTGALSFGDVNVHLHGFGMPKPEDMKKLATGLLKEVDVQRRMAGKDAARVSKKNADPGSW